MSRDAAELSVGDSMSYATVGRYSGTVNKKRIGLLVLIAATVCVDVIRLYHRNDAVEDNLV